MASPVVTGIAALLAEQWRKTFAGANPQASQLKALILAGADDLGNPGPDYTYGFGLVNAKNSVDLIIADGGKGDRIRNFTFQQGQVLTQRSCRSSFRSRRTCACPAVGRPGDAIPRRPTTSRRRRS